MTTRRNAAGRRNLAEANWTPGPWVFSRIDNMEHGADLEESGIHGSIVGGPRDMIIARIWADGGHPDADAALIAAAPDLYAALRDALVALSRGGGPQFGPKGADVGLPTRIRTALARARGES